jgi:hypothetical protein
MFTPFDAGESSAVPMLAPFASFISTLTVFFAAAVKTIGITSAAVIAIDLSSRIVLEVYPNPVRFFPWKIL